MRVNGTDEGGGDKYNRRKFLRTTGAAATGTVMVSMAGCLGGNQQGDGTGRTKKKNGGKVVYLSDRGTASKPIKDAIAAFEKETDYTIELTFVPKGTSMNEQLAKMRAANNLPSMVFETAADAYRQTKQGQTAPVTDLVNTLGVKDPVHINGESYHVPSVMIPLMGYYRTDIVKGSPRTRKEWLAEAKRISNEKDMSGMVIASGRTNNATTQMVQTHWQDDVDIYSGTPGNIKVTIDKGKNRKRAIRTYDWIQQMDQFSPNASGWGWGDVAAAFYQGSTASIVSVCGLPILQVRANRPSLEKKMKAMPIPHTSGASGGNWWAYLEGHYLYKNGPNLDGARKFIKFFMQSKYYWQFLLGAPLNTLPPNRKMIDNERFTSNKVVQAHPHFMELIRNNWKRFRPILLTGDNHSPNLLAAKSYGKQLFGQSAAQALIGAKPPAETVDWVAEKLRSLKSV
jgi:multiple sugar transport system substrate-binding protein